MMSIARCADAASVDAIVSEQPSVDELLGRDR